MSASSSDVSGAFESPPEFLAVRGQLRRILDSHSFAESGRLRSLLSFLVEQRMLGHTDRIRESVIAVEVFARNAEFDPRIDSIVRVQVRNLRRKLEEYSSSEGQDDPVLISLPKGSYVPEFQIREARPVPVPAARKRVRLSVVTGLAAALCIAAAGAWWLGLRAAAPAPEESGPSGARHTPEPETQELYLKGVYLRGRQDPESRARGIAILELAAARDPHYAPALAAFAAACANESFHSAPHRLQWAEKAKDAARRAIAVDNGSVKAYYALAWVTCFHDRDWVAAEGGFRKALSLNPQHAASHNLYALGLTTRGRFEEAIAEARRAREIDPAAYTVSTDLGLIYYLARRFVDGEKFVRSVLAMDSGFTQARMLAGICLAGQERWSEALAEIQPLSGLDGAEVWGRLGYVLARSGDKAGALKCAARISTDENGGGDFASSLALIHAGLGDRDKAFEWLEKAADRRETAVVFAGVEPMLESLRAGPRFETLRQRLGL
ncbi:MAG: hypothetical protein NTY38_07910 [Acidobacteria bacterium]|nr:hypothetical protein [Acidobacteriota bacterium]